MRKLLVLGLSFCTILAFTSCKSNESAYKKAYDKALTEELAETGTIPVEYAPVVNGANGVTPVTPPATNPSPVVVEQPTNDVRKEEITYVSGNEALKAYSVVCGSFGLKSNAENLKDYLNAQGYNATIAFNPQKAMYRVIVDSFNDHTSATRARDTFKAKYPGRGDFQGSWVLYKTN